MCKLRGEYIMTKKEDQIIIVAHGGVGSLLRFSDGPTAAAREAFKVLGKTNSALKAAVAGVVVLEDDPHFDAGTGSYFRLDGKSIEMDAAVMDSNNQVGAIACIQRVKNPVKVAYALLDTPHTFLCGEGATEFARLKGFTDFDPVTPKAKRLFRKRIREFKVNKIVLWARQKWIHAKKEKYVRKYLNNLLGTVGVLVKDTKNNFAVAVSTGGTSLALPGRIGDTPLIGCGFYVGKSGAVLATGVGEEITRQLLSRKVYEKIKEGMHPQEACEWGMSLFPAKTPVGIAALSLNDYGIKANKQIAKCVFKGKYI